MKVHYPKLYNMAHLSLNVFTAPKGSNNYILFAITAAGVVPCGGPKKSPRTSSIVQIIFSFDPFRSVKIFGVFKIYCMLRIIILTEFFTFGPFGNIGL